MKTAVKQKSALVQILTEVACDRIVVVAAKTVPNHMVPKQCHENAKMVPEHCKTI